MAKRATTSTVLKGRASRIPRPVGGASRPRRALLSCRSDGPGRHFLTRPGPAGPKPRKRARPGAPREGRERSPVRVPSHAACWLLRLASAGGVSSPLPAVAGPPAERAGAGSRHPRGRGVFVDLLPAQVEHVVRAAAGGGSISVLLSGQAELTRALATLKGWDDERLSRSLLAGLVVLGSFPADGSFVANGEIARMLDMNPSTSHRYVSTLVAVGLLERDPETRRYRRPR